MKCTAETEIKDLFIQSTYRPDPTNSHRLQITYDRDAAEDLTKIERLVHDIIEYKDDQLFIVRDQRNGMTNVRPTRLTKVIISTVYHYTGSVDNHFPIHEFNPYIKVFFKRLKEGGLIDHIKHYEQLISRSNVSYNTAEYSDFMVMAESIEALVDNIRRDVQQPEFKSLIYSSRRLSKKNYNGLVTYIDSLFARHHRLLVVRVDFSYHVGNIITQKSEILTKYQEAKDDLHRFKTNMRSNGLFKHMLGYVWKLEYGAEKGFHYHMLFFFDGSKVRKDENLAMMIGEYWKHNITEGRGIYHNCNANKNSYRSLGIGMINYSDTALRLGLNKAAAYLVKVDYYARILTPNNERTFGRCEILAPKRDNRGRPRLESI